MFEADGDWARLSCLTDSWSDKSAMEPTEVSGDPSREAIVKMDGNSNEYNKTGLVDLLPPHRSQGVEGTCKVTHR